MSNSQNIANLFKQLELGDVVEGPLRVKGGLLHLIYKVKTKDYVYAVKRLNPMIMKRETAFNNFVFSEKFARYAKKNGINSAPAIHLKDKVVHKYNNHHYLIYNWIEGESGDKKHIDLVMCEKIGRTLAQIHELRYREGIDQKNIIEMIDWKHYISLAKQNHSIWSSQFISQVSLIEEIEKKTILALEEHENNIISHRDLDPKNIIWNNDMNPVVIDWEATGPTNMNVELLEVAMYWSNSGKNKEAFQSVIQSYQKIRSFDLIVLLNALYCINDGKLKWLQYNMKRSLGIESSSEEEQLLGTREVISTSKDIVDFTNNISMIKNHIKELI